MILTLTEALALYQQDFMHCASATWLYTDVPIKVGGECIFPHTPNNAYGSSSFYLVVEKCNIKLTTQSFYITYCLLYQHNWESNYWFRWSEDSDRWHCIYLIDKLLIQVPNKAFCFVLLHATVSLFHIHQTFWHVPYDMKQAASWAGYCAFSIWGHFFMQMSMAVHKHIFLECVGFISGCCIQLCLPIHDKFQFSYSYRWLLFTNLVHHNRHVDHCSFIPVWIWTTPWSNFNLTHINYIVYYI